MIFFQVGWGVFLPFWSVFLWFPRNAITSLQCLNWLLHLGWNACMSNFLICFIIIQCRYFRIFLPLRDITISRWGKCWPIPGTQSGSSIDSWMCQHLLWHKTLVLKVTPKNP
jgi:hypothetical protein